MAGPRYLPSPPLLSLDFAPAPPPPPNFIPLLRAGEFRARDVTSTLPSLTPTIDTLCFNNSSTRQHLAIARALHLIGACPQCAPRRAW